MSEPDFPYLGDPDPSQWPPHVRQMKEGETWRLGIDEDARIYWDGKPISVISERRLVLSRMQKIAAVLVGFAAFAGGIGVAVQGWSAGHDYACKVGWLNASCPKS